MARIAGRDARRQGVTGSGSRGAGIALRRHCRSRNEFKQAYDRKDFDGAYGLMTALWNDCVADLTKSREKTIDPVLRAWLSKTPPCSPTDAAATTPACRT